MVARHCGMNVMVVRILTAIVALELAGRQSEVSDRYAHDEQDDAINTN